MKPPLIKTHFLTYQLWGGEVIVQPEKPFRTEAEVCDYLFALEDDKRTFMVVAMVWRGGNPEGFVARDYTRQIGKRLAEMSDAWEDENREPHEDFHPLAELAGFEPMRTAEDNYFAKIDYEADMMREDA